MLLMVSGGFGIPKVAQNLPDSFWTEIAPLFEHAPWAGGVLWDMIQPAFMFMVGVAAAFSVAKRKERGDSWGAILLHAAIRAVVLVLLAVFLASNWNSKATNWSFTNVLGQIGLGYFFLVLFAMAGQKVRTAAAVLLLVGTWVAFVRHPAGRPDPATLKWMTEYDLFSGFFAHWNPHTNYAADFDRWFLNLFPRPGGDHEFSNGGYQTLNFVPSLATMLLGLIVGEKLRTGADSKANFRTLIIWGVALIAIGLVAGHTICPIVKRIWTPSWALWSGGIAILMLAAFYSIIDIHGWKRWAFPLTVVGMNSIAVYMGSQLTKPWIKDTVARHFGGGIFKGPHGPMAESFAVLMVLWLMCLWLWKQKAFLRI
jgi:heparan-alpha-glucosaminide N-acetyltransferase